MIIIYHPNLTQDKKKSSTLKFYRDRNDIFYPIFFHAWFNSQHLLSMIRNFGIDLMEWPMVQVEKVGTLIWIWWSCLRFV